MSLRSLIIIMTLVVATAAVVIGYSLCAAASMDSRKRELEERIRAQERINNK